MLDDCRTEGLTPPKTHWARPIDTPPFYGYPLRPGITFTYLGLKVDERAAVHFGGRPSPNLFAAGEMMAGNVLGQGYTAGVGMSDRHRVRAHRRRCRLPRRSRKETGMERLKPTRTPQSPIAARAIRSADGAKSRA